MALVSLCGRRTMRLAPAAALCARRLSASRHTAQLLTGGFVVSDQVAARPRLPQPPRLARGHEPYVDPRQSPRRATLCASLLWAVHRHQCADG